MKTNFKCSFHGCNEPATYYDGAYYCRNHHNSMMRYGHPYGSQRFAQTIYLPDYRYPDDCCAIKIGSGDIYTFDLEDLDIARFYDWTTTGAEGYAGTKIYNNNIVMHRLILLREKYSDDEFRNYVIDHKNNNNHDNRKCNLRIATTKENSWNKYSNNIHLENGEYVVRFYSGNKVIYNQKFSNLKDAEDDRNRKRSELYGEFDYGKYLDTSIYDRKVQLVREYDDMIEKMKSNSEIIATQPFYVDRSTYKSTMRKNLNLPEPVSSKMYKDGTKCSICSELAFTSYKGVLYCEKHYNSMLSYKQPFGYSKLRNSKVNIKIKNFNNSGYSVLIMNKKDIAIFEAEYSDLVFKYNWRCSFKNGVCTKNVSSIMPMEDGSYINLTKLLLSQKYPEINKIDKLNIEFKNSNPLDYRIENLVYSGITPIGGGISRSMDKKKENGEFRGVYPNYQNNKIVSYSVRIKANKEYIYM